MFLHGMLSEEWILYVYKSLLLRRVYIQRLAWFVTKLMLESVTYKPNIVCDLLKVSSLWGLIQYKDTQTAHLLKYSCKQVWVVAKEQGVGPLTRPVIRPKTN